jgi:hypothetical protein
VWYNANMRSLLVRLVPLRSALLIAPPHEWPRVAWSWLRNRPSAEAVEAFLRAFRERTWPATPDAIQPACAYVSFTTHTWPRFHLGVFADNVPILFEVCTAGTEAAEMIHAALTPVVATAETFTIGLTRLSPESD